MKSCEVSVNGTPAAIFTEEIPQKKYRLQYLPGYREKPVSLTMPVREDAYLFETFPAFFDGLLPEGLQLEHSLKVHKIDRADGFGLLVKLGADMVGHVTVRSLS